MRILLAVLLMSVSAQASTVRFALTNWNAGTPTNWIQVVPRWPTLGSSSIVTGLPLWMAPVNGVVTTNILAGTYELRLRGISFPQPFYFTVPDDSQTYDVTTLTVSGGQPFVSSPPFVTSVSASNTTDSAGVVGVYRASGGGVTIAIGTNVPAGTGGSGSVTNLDMGSSVEIGSVTTTNINNQAYLDLTKPTRLVFKGDSLTQGYGVTPYPTYLTNAYLTGTNWIWATNAGVAGEMLITMYQDYATEISPWKPAGGTNAVLFIWAGVNDWVTNDCTTLFLKLSNYWRVARADGFTVAAFTVPTTISGDTSYLNGQREILNASIRAASSQWDYLVDVDRLFPGWQFSRFDSVHFSTNSNAMIAREVARILSLPRHTVSPPTPLESTAKFHNLWASNAVVQAGLSVSNNVSAAGLQMYADGTIGRGSGGEFYMSSLGILGRAYSGVQFNIDDSNSGASNVFTVKKGTISADGGTELMSISTSGEAFIRGTLDASNPVVGSVSGRSPIRARGSHTDVYTTGSQYPHLALINSDTTVSNHADIAWSDNAAGDYPYAALVGICWDHANNYGDLYIGNRSGSGWGFNFYFGAAGNFSTKGNIVAGGQFIGNGAGLTNLPSSGSASNAIANSSGSGTNTTLYGTTTIEQLSMVGGTNLLEVQDTNGVPQFWITSAGVVTGNGAGLTNVSGTGGTTGALTNNETRSLNLLGNSNYLASAATPSLTVLGTGTNEFGASRFTNFFEVVGSGTNVFGYSKFTNVAEGKWLMQTGGVVVGVDLPSSVLASGAATTNLTIYGDQYRTNAAYIGSGGEVLSNANGSVTIAGGNVTASKLTGTNFNHVGTTVANLPTPAANEFPIIYATDAVTSSGTGGYVRWNGSSWKTWENVTATANVFQFIINGFASGLNASTPLSSIIFNTDIYYATTLQSPIFFLTGVGGATTTGSGALADGTYCSSSLSTGTAGGVYGYGPRISITSGGFYAYYSQICFSAGSDATDSYWCVIGMTGAASTNYPTYGAYFLFDPSNANSHGITGASTNNWISVTANSTTYSYSDTGLPASLNTTNFNRLAVILTSTNCVFYTNGILATTHTSNLPSVTTMLFQHGNKFVRSAGTTAKSMYLRNCALNIRYPTSRTF